MVHNEQEQLNVNKRKREVRTVVATTLSKSLSRLSMSQPTTKKPCSSSRRDGRRRKKQQTYLPNCKSHNWPNFLSVPDAVFKQQLFAEVKSDRTTIELWLETEAMLQYARRSACLTSDVCYLKAEQDFWELYVTTAMAEATWLSQLPKSTLTSSHIQWPYCKTEKNIRKRQKAIQKKLEVAAMKLNEHLQQPLPLFLEPSEGTNLTLNNLSAAVLSFVHKGQHRLRDGFKRKEATLKSDINDIRLIKAFSELQPTQEQV
jgi:hypothetical protein